MKKLLYALLPLIYATSNWCMENDYNDYMKNDYREISLGAFKKLSQQSKIVNTTCPYDLPKGEHNNEVKINIICEKCKKILKNKNLSKAYGNFTLHKCKETLAISRNQTIACFGGYFACCNQPFNGHTSGLAYDKEAKRTAIAFHNKKYVKEAPTDKKCQRMLKAKNATDENQVITTSKLCHTIPNSWYNETMHTGDNNQKTDSGNVKKQKNSKKHKRQSTTADSDDASTSSSCDEDDKAQIPNEETIVIEENPRKKIKLFGLEITSGSQVDHKEEQKKTKTISIFGQKIHPGPHQNEASKNTWKLDLDNSDSE